MYIRIRGLDTLGLEASDSIKHDRTGFIVKMTCEQRFERSIMLAL